MADVRISALVAVAAANIAAADVFPATNTTASPATTYKYSLAQLRTALFAASGSGWGTADNLVVTGTAQVNADGGLSIGAAPVSGRALNIQSTNLTQTTQFGLYNKPVFSSSATSGTVNHYVKTVTAAAAFTVPTAYGIWVDTVSKGAGSAITTYYGVYLDPGASAGGTTYSLYANSGLAHFGAGLEVTSGTSSLQAVTATSVTASGNVDIQSAQSLRLWKSDNSAHIDLAYSSGIVNVTAGMTLASGLTVSAGGITVQAGTSSFQAATVAAGLTVNGSTTTKIQPTIASGSDWSLQVVGAASAARDIFLAGMTGVSNGLTVQYDGTRMVYKLANLPTATTGLTSGALWNNSGVVNIVP